MAKRPIFYDTETTGLKPNKDRIIEIAAYDPQRNRTFHSLVNPECPIPPDAMAIHHITDCMVEEAPTFEKVAARFVEFCCDDMVLIAHNNDSFDKPFLECEFSRHNLVLPKWDYIDSLKFSRKYRPDLPQHSLQYLREYHDIPSNNAHRALDDVIVLHQVFCELIDDLPMEIILELMDAKNVLLQMPFGKYRGQPLETIPSGYVRWLHENGGLDTPQNAELRNAFESLGLLKSNAH